MPTPAPGNPISFAQVNTEFTLTTPSPMDLKYRLAPGTYTPATPVIPTTPGSTFPMDVLHGRTTGLLTTFTTPGNWTSSVTGNIRVLVVAGGGSGGALTPGTGAGTGGGGAGGVVYCTSFPVVSGTVYPYTVGSGGIGDSPGAPSSFSTILALGGGKGGISGTPASSPGGSGGGTSGQNSAPVTLATQPAQPQPPNCTNYGNPGAYRIGPSPVNPIYNAGGGGGAGAAAVTPAQSPGGDGIAISITGSSVYYGGGGGGGGRGFATGGLGGGGNGAQYPGPAAGDATFYGGGGGGCVYTQYVAGNGYPGCVIIAYP